MRNRFHVILFMTLCVASTRHVSAQTFRTVAFTGDPVPGASPDDLFQFFSHPPVINNASHTAFVGDFGLNFSGRTPGVWSEGSGDLALVTREGDLSPGTLNGETFTSFSDVNINEVGQTAFRGVLQGPTVDSGNSSGIWSESVSNLSLVAREGDAAPGVSIGSTFISLGPHVFNDSGHTAFTAGASGEVRNGIWMNAEESLTNIARSVSSRSSEGVSLNARGTIAFASGGAGHAVLRVNDGVSTKVAGKDDVGPNGNVFNYFQSVGLNAVDETVFLAQDKSFRRQVIVENGGLSVLAEDENGLAPGTNVEFGSMFNTVINANGGVALLAVVEFPSSSFGVWSSGRGELESVALVGADAPGVTGTASFANFGFSDIVLNSAGQTAFRASLEGNAIHQSNDVGIWAEDRSGELEIIVREGDLLDVDDGPDIDLRTVLQLAFVGGDGPDSSVFASATGNEDGRPSGFNDAGQVAFGAIFTDGTSGIFVSDLVAEFEPGSSCDFDADGDCDHDDIDELYATNPRANDIANWLSEAADADNPWKTDAVNNPGGSATDVYVVGDVNLDGDVNSVDLGLLLNNFNGTTFVGWGGGDLTADNLVDSVDLGRLLNNFNFTSASANAVPEPNAMVLLGIGLLAVLRVRRLT